MDNSEKWATWEAPKIFRPSFGKLRICISPSPWCKFTGERTKHWWNWKQKFCHCSLASIDPPVWWGTNTLAPSLLHTWKHDTYRSRRTCIFPSWLLMSAIIKNWNYPKNYISSMPDRCVISVQVFCKEFLQTNIRTWGNFFSHAFYNCGSSTGTCSLTSLRIHNYATERVPWFIEILCPG